MNIANGPLPVSANVSFSCRCWTVRSGAAFTRLLADSSNSSRPISNVGYAVSTFNGTVSLEMMLHVAGIGPGDEVIVPAISFVSTATAVSRVGATPVFVDIEPCSFNLDPERVAAAITSQDASDSYRPFRRIAVRDRCAAAVGRQHGIILFEDAAHAHGSEWKGQASGKFRLGQLVQFSEWQGDDGGGRWDRHHQRSPIFTIDAGRLPIRAGARAPVSFTTSR